MGPVDGRPRGPASTRRPALSGRQYTEAIPFAARYAKAIGELKSDDDPEYARARYSLGQLLKATNKFAEAEQLYRRAGDIDEKAFGPEDPRVGDIADSLALLLHKTGGSPRLSH